MAQVIFPAVVVPGSTADPAEPSSPSDGQIWVDTDGTAPTTVVTRWSKSPTNGTTTLSGTDDTTNTLAYTPGYEQVFLNGVLLSRGSDYTATTGTSVVLTTGTVTSDIVEIIAALQVAYTDTITTAAAATTYVAKALTTTTGDIIYASAANTPARLGIGSSAQVLTVASGIPSWATPATPTSGLTFITGTTFSAVSSVSIPAATFSATYLNYKVVFVTDSASGTASALSLRLRISSTDNSTANYYGAMAGASAGGTAQIINSNGLTSFPLGTTDSPGTNGSVYDFDITNPFASIRTNINGVTNTFVTNGTGLHGSMGFFFNGTTSFDSFSIIVASGTITGHYKIYGYANS